MVVVSAGLVVELSVVVLSVVDFSVVVISVDCSVEVSIAFSKESEELTTLEADCTILYVAASTW